MADEKDEKEIDLTQGVPKIIDWENPENILDIQSVRMDGYDALKTAESLINEGFQPEKTLVLLGMSVKFPQTNFHKIVTIFVKRK